MAGSYIPLQTSLSRKPSLLRLSHLLLDVISWLGEQQMVDASIRFQKIFPHRRQWVQSKFVSLTTMQTGKVISVLAGLKDGHEQLKTSSKESAMNIDNINKDSLLQTVFATTLLLELFHFRQVRLERRRLIDANYTSHKVLTVNAVDNTSIFMPLITSIDLPLKESAGHSFIVPEQFDFETPTILCAANPSSTVIDGLPLNCLEGTDPQRCPFHMVTSERVKIKVICSDNTKDEVLFAPRNHAFCQRH